MPQCITGDTNYNYLNLFLLITTKVWLAYIKFSHDPKFEQIMRTNLILGTKI